MLTAQDREYLVNRVSTKLFERAKLLDSEYLNIPCSEEHRRLIVHTEARVLRQIGQEISDGMLL